MLLLDMNEVQTNQTNIQYITISLTHHFDIISHWVNYAKFLKIM